MLAGRATAQLGTTYLRRSYSLKMRYATCFFCGNESIFMKNTAEECRKGAIPGKRVLVVDDDIGLLMTCQELLQAHDYQTSLAQNGAQALEVMKHRKVDAILCDLDMPELSGDLLYMAVGRAWPQLLKSFIFVTGNAENPTYEEFLKRAKATVLSKPFSINGLLEKLQAVLGSQPQQAT